MKGTTREKKKKGPKVKFLQQIVSRKRTDGEKGVFRKIRQKETGKSEGGSAY